MMEARARLPWRQAQLIGDARRLCGVHDPTGQAACLEFGSKQAVGTLWQSVIVDVVELAVIDDDAFRSGSLAGEPIVSWPAGTTISSGQTVHGCPSASASRKPWP